MKGKHEVSVQCQITLFSSICVEKIIQSILKHTQQNTTFEQTYALIWTFLYLQSSDHPAEAVGLEDQGHQGLVEEACHWELLVEEIHSPRPLDKTFLYSILLC